MVVKINTHPIVTGMHEEYHMNWVGKIKDTKPMIKNNKPIFIVSGSKGCVELNTLDMDWIERTARSFTDPHGRKSVSTDKSCVYLKEENGKETLMGIMTHNHIKSYRPMFDEFEYE